MRLDLLLGNYRGKPTWTGSQILNSRKEFNFVESKVPAYKLPDPLIGRDGQVIDTAEAWNGFRRAELLNLFRNQVYGNRPRKEYELDFVQVAEKADVWNGLATGHSMSAVVTIGDREYKFPFVLFIPNGIQKPVPAVIHINNRYFIPLDKAAVENDPFGCTNAGRKRVCNGFVPYFGC